MNHLKNFIFKQNKFKINEQDFLKTKLFKIHNNNNNKNKLSLNNLIYRLLIWNEIKKNMNLVILSKIY